MPKTIKRGQQGRGSQRYTSKEFLPYATALGQLTLAWNDLQESLAALFWKSMMPGPPQAGDFVSYTALWVWRSIKTDRMQRDMLKAAVDHPSEQWNRPKLTEDVNWLVDKVTSLEDARNDAIHTPLFATSLYMAVPSRINQ